MPQDKGDTFPEGGGLPEAANKGNRKFPVNPDTLDISRPDRQNEKKDLKRFKDTNNGEFDPGSG